jgi:hypothetical protein
VGEHSEKRQWHEGKVIPKLRAADGELEGQIAEEKEKSAEAGRKSAQLAPRAVSGDRKALSEQADLLRKKSEHDLQVQNLETLRVPIRTQLAEAEAELPRFILCEQLEVANLLAERVPQVAASLTQLVTPCVEQAAACAKLIGDILANLHLLGERSRYQRLERSLQTAVLDGVRAALNNAFSAAGFPLLDAPRLLGLDFAGVVVPRISNVRRAFEMTLHSQTGVAVKGRAMFLVKTNIGGLFGLDVLHGERISLDTSDPDVLSLVSRSAVERIEGKGAAA